MKSLSVLLLAMCCLMIGCKKDIVAVKQSSTPGEIKTGDKAVDLDSTPASALKGVNWAADGTDSFYTGAYYRFLNVNNGLALDVNAASAANGAGIIQWPQNGGNNQQWVITGNGGGYYKVTKRNSGQALDVNGGLTANGAGIIQWPRNGGNNQQYGSLPLPAQVYIKPLTVTAGLRLMLMVHQQPMGQA